MSSPILSFAREGLERPRRLGVLVVLLDHRLEDRERRPRPLDMLAGRERRQEEAKSVPQGRARDLELPEVDDDAAEDRRREVVRQRLREGPLRMLLVTGRTKGSCGLEEVVSKGGKAQVARGTRENRGLRAMTDVLLEVARPGSHGPGLAEGQGGHVCARIVGEVGCTGGRGARLLRRRARFILHDRPKNPVAWQHLEGLGRLAEEEARDDLGDLGRVGDLLGEHIVAPVEPPRLHVHPGLPDGGREARSVEPREEGAIRVRQSVARDGRNRREASERDCEHRRPDPESAPSHHGRRVSAIPEFSSGGEPHGVASESAGRLGRP